MIHSVSAANLLPIIKDYEKLCADESKAAAGIMDISYNNMSETQREIADYILETCEGISQEQAVEALNRLGEEDATDIG